MKIPEVESLREALASGASIPMVLLAGGDDAVREGVVKVMTGGSSAVVRLDAAPERTDAWQRLDEIVATVPMFGERTVVLVTGYSCVKNPTLDAFLAGPADHVRVVLCADRKHEKAAFAKEIAAKGRVIAPEEVRDSQAKGLVFAAAKVAGLKVEDHAATVIGDMVGSDRTAIETAIAMLREYKGPGEVVTDADLPGLVSRTRKSPPWDLDDAIAAKDLGRAVKAACRMLEEPKGSAMGILFHVARYARKLLVARALIARKTPDSEAMKTLKLSPYPWKKLTDASRQYTDRQLRDFLKELPRWETLFKRGDKDGQDALVTDLLARLITLSRRKG
jgi:DNA polymerase-3 subunit delta